MFTITTIRRIAKAPGMYHLPLLKKKICPGFTFYLEWPTECHYEVVFNVGDVVIGRRLAME